MEAPDFDPGPLAEARWHADGGRWTLVFTRTLKHPPAAVWAALTEAAQVGEWAPYTTDRDLGSPGEATLTMIDGDVAEPFAATVTRAEAPTLLEYSWADDHLRWELEPVTAGTRLTLSHTLADRDSIPKIAAGWHICLVVADRLLAGQPIGPIRGEQAMEYGWEELRDAYAAELSRHTPGGWPPGLPVQAGPALCVRRGQRNGFSTRTPP